MTETERRIKAKIPGDDTGISIKKSICAICDPGTQCGLNAYVQNGTIVKVEGDENHPYNKGTLCTKGAVTRQYVYHKDRIQTPLKRVGQRGSGLFEPISWEEALDTIAQKCALAKREYGPESVVFFSGYPKYYRSFLMRLAHSFGSPNYATESSTCSTATGIAQRLVYGASAAPDISRTDCLLVWSSNPFYTNHGKAQTLLDNLARGMKMIVVDPRRTPTTVRAQLHLQPRPGTDGALALSMAHVILSEGLHDPAVTERFSYGFEEYCEYVRQFPPERGEALTGVPAGDIIRAAKMFAEAKAASIMPSASPVVHHTNGVQNYRAVFMLLPLTGNLDVPGGNLIHPWHFMHVGCGFENREKEFEEVCPLDEMPPRIGADKFPVWMKTVPDEAQAMALPQQIRTGQPYRIANLVAFGMNHRMWPDSERFLNSLEQLDFFANTDLYMTDTCRYADIVLPACTSLERSEFRCYASGYVMLSQPVISPLYKSRSDIDIIFDLAKRLCPEDKLLATDYETCMDWMLQPSGITMSQLKRHPGGMSIPRPISVEYRQYEKGCATPSGRIEFCSKVLEPYGQQAGLEALPIYHPPKFSPEASPEQAEEYPFILNTGSRLPMFLHSRMYRFSWPAQLRKNYPSADIHPQDALALSIYQDEEISISTPNGHIQVKANITEDVLPGVVHIYHGHRAADVNRLFPGDYWDPISGFPGFKSALCKIQKASGRDTHAK